MAAKTPSHHQVLLKQLGKTNVHNIEEICLHSNTSRLLSVHVRGNKKGKGQLINAVLSAKVAPKTINDLKKIAKSNALRLEESKGELRLFV